MIYSINSAKAGKTKKIVLSLIVVAVLFMSANQLNLKAGTNSTGGRDVTLTGEVVDLSCYLGNGDMGRGPDHKECAITCAKAGSSLCIITKAGEVYFPVVGMGKNNNEKLVEFAGDNVEVTGTVVTQSGLKGIKITSIKKTE